MASQQECINILYSNTDFYLWTRRLKIFWDNRIEREINVQKRISYSALNCFRCFRTYEITTDSSAKSGEKNQNTISNLNLVVSSWAKHLISQDLVRLIYRNEGLGSDVSKARSSKKKKKTHQEQQT